MTPSPFIFVICQNGAETVCRTEVLANHEGLKVAFARPGFLTFKCDPEVLPEKFHLKSTFARTCGWSVGNTTAADINDQIQALLELDVIQHANHLHIWQRDRTQPGTKGFEPGPTVLAQLAGEQVAAAISSATGKKIPLNRNAKADELVFDIVMVEPDNWWLGYHYSIARSQSWPGGVPRMDVDQEVVSRAYFKLQEALLWSGIRIQTGDVCTEIGSSPGGACQLLLEKGATVIAVDPAEMDPEIAGHENLTHLRCRGREVRRKDLKDVRWLISDINVTPNYTLDTIVDIVSNQHTRSIRGLILTLKITDWKLATDIPVWKQRIRDLGFQIVKTRQLAFNRNEICLVAVRDRFALRSSRLTKYINHRGSNETPKKRAGN